MAKEPRTLDVVHDGLGERGTLGDWIDKNRRGGSWGGFTAVAFLSCMLKMNITITSNFANGFVHQSTCSNLHCQITTNTPTACLCHHLRARPTVPSHQCNHYALLEPQPNVDNSMSRQVHSGCTCAEEDKTPHDLSHDHAINIKQNAMNNCEMSVNGGDSNRVMKKITSNKRSKDCIKNYHFHNKSSKKSSALNAQDPFSDSDAQTEVESTSSCKENNKDKEPKTTKKKKYKVP